MENARGDKPSRRAWVGFMPGAWPLLALVVACGAIVAMPAPAGLPEAGKRVLAVAALAIGLWTTGAIPAAVTSLVLILALALSGGVASFPQALSGFAEPVAYFLIGVLTIGLAVAKSGLAERVARASLARSRGDPSAFFAQLLLSFPLLTLILPSATTRTGILVHVYEQALALAAVPRRAPLARAVMMALNSVNRLASTILLTGGITPLVAASLIGGVYWSQWLLLMCVPYLALLAVASASIYLAYRSGFRERLPELALPAPSPLSGRERRTLAITLGASALWLTDSLHGLHPAVPAVLAWALLVMPRIGVLTWNEFEREIGWTNFFVLASSMSLAKALVDSGAAGWVAASAVSQLPALRESPMLLLAALLIAAVPLRMLIPNISGFLATTIPLAMSIGQQTDVNPLICALAVMIAGDAVLYYPAQSASSLVVYERGYLSAPEIFRFGVWMTLVAFVVVLTVAVPYWTALGEGLRAY